MDINSVDSLCIRILNKLKQQREIREEQISLFLKLSLKIIDSTEELELPRSFYLLKENVYKCWLYEEIGELDANQAFVYGNLWGALKLIDFAKKSRENRKVLDSLACQYEKNSYVFQIMNDNPGIKHKDLAELSNKTPSELSQFLSKIKEEQLFYDVRLGREKYYYLEERGISLLNKMKKQAEDKLNYSIQSYYWNTIKNNSITTTKHFFIREFDEKHKFQMESEHLLNNPRSEYLESLKDKLIAMLNELEGVTIYTKRIEQNDTKIAHYINESGEFDKIFEASIKSPNKICSEKDVEFEEETEWSPILSVI